MDCRSVPDALQGGENLGSGNRRGRDASQSDLETSTDPTGINGGATGSAARLENAVVAVPATTA